MSKTNLTLLVTLMVSLSCCVVGGIQVNLLHQVVVIAEHVATMHLVDERASPPINDCFRRIASMIWSVPLGVENRRVQGQKLEPTVRSSHSTGNFE